MAGKLKTRRVTIIRRIVQAAFGLFIVGSSIAHKLIAESTGAAIASAEALCPFGAVENHILEHTLGHQRAGGARPSWASGLSLRS